jgi:hypothetical protein
MIQRIISGGQTGVDRAALDVALERGIPCGGKCPRGRRAEDGPIDARYPLEETESEEYAVRTEMNVRDADGTLILLAGKPDAGTELTQRLAVQHGPPCLSVDLATTEAPADVVRDWLHSTGIAVLNVAGPRESSAPGIYEKACAFLRELLDTSAAKVT